MAVDYLHGRRTRIRYRSGREEIIDETWPVATDWLRAMLIKPDGRQLAAEQPAAA